MVTRETVSQLMEGDRAARPDQLALAPLIETPPEHLIRERRSAGREWLGSGLRLCFGLIWAIDAYFKWQPSFIRGILVVLDSGADDQPGWLRPWFAFAHGAVALQPRVWAYAIALVETALAMALLLGLARKVTYLGGALWSLIIWSTAQGFGHVPAGTIATDIGAGVAYAVAFLALLATDRRVGTDHVSMDAVIERRIPRWRQIAEAAPWSGPRPR